MSKKVEIRQVRISKTPVDCECCWGENCKVANDEFPHLVKLIGINNACKDFFVEADGTIRHSKDLFDSDSQNITKFWVLEEELNKVTVNSSTMVCGVLAEPPEPGNLFPRQK